MSTTTSQRRRRTRVSPSPDYSLPCSKRAASIRPSPRWWCLWGSWGDPVGSLRSSLASTTPTSLVLGMVVLGLTAACRVAFGKGSTRSPWCEWLDVVGWRAFGLLLCVSVWLYQVPLLLLLMPVELLLVSLPRSIYCPVCEVYFKYLLIIDFNFF